jgi:hypothetical protein
MAQKSKARFIGPIIAAVGIPLAFLVGYLIDTKATAQNYLLHVVVVLGIEAVACFVVVLVMISVAGFTRISRTKDSERGVTL